MIFYYRIHVDDDYITERTIYKPEYQKSKDVSHNIVFVIEHFNFRQRNPKNI